LPPAIQRYKVHLCRIETQEITVFCGEDLYSSPGDTLLDSGLLHNRGTDLDALCGRWLGSMSASQRYRLCLCRIKAQEVAVFCGEDLYSRRGDILLDGGLLHNRWTDLDTLCGRLLGLTPDTLRYKVRLCRIKTQEIAVFCGEDLYSSPGDISPDSRLLNNRGTDLDALCGTLLVPMLASQRYRLGLCRIKAQDVAVFCGEDLYSNTGDMLLNGRLLHHRWTDFDSVCGRLLGLPPASQGYRFHPSATFIHDVTGSRVGGVPGSLRLRGGLNLPVNGYFVRRLRLLMSIMMGVSMWIRRYIGTIVE